MPTALVTGATAGIGNAFARALAVRGDDVVLVARDAIRLARTADELRANGVTIEEFPADLSDARDLARVAARVESSDAPIDLLINNAGFAVGGDLLDADPAPLEEAMAVMVEAVMVLSAAAGRAMLKRGHGAILNLGSLAGFTTTGLYSPIKAWVINYSESLANELHGTGVTVTVLCPGWVRTEFHERAHMSTTAIPDWVWVDADRVVRETLSDVAAGRIISIPTKRWKVAHALLAHAPRSSVRAASRMLTKSRH